MRRGCTKPRYRSTEGCACNACRCHSSPSCGCSNCWKSCEEDAYCPWWSSTDSSSDLSIRGSSKSMQMVIFLPWMFLLTALFLAWSFYNIYVNIALGCSETILYGVLFFIMGAYIGMREVYSWRYYKNGPIPRNYSTLIFVILNFILKFFWGYFYTTYTEIPCWMYLIDMITSSLVTGFFVGRTGFFYKAYLSASPALNGRRSIKIRGL